MDGKRILAEGIAAKKQILEAQMTLWNVRLEALVDTGDIGRILDHLQAPVDDAINNCGCNVQCGARDAGFGGVVTPAMMAGTAR